MKEQKEKKIFKGFGEIQKLDLNVPAFDEEIFIYAACTGGGYPGNTTSCLS